MKGRQEGGRSVQQQQILSRDFSLLLSAFQAFRLHEMGLGIDPEPFRGPLFSSNWAKKRVVMRKYSLITRKLTNRGCRPAALDIGPGFGALLPVLSATHSTVNAVEAYDDQLRVAVDLCKYFGLRNVRVSKIELNHELDELQRDSFDTVVAADVLEHVRHWYSMIEGIRKVLKPGGMLIVSLPREHLVYRLLARREVENDPIRGHMYHTSKGADEIESHLSRTFRLVEHRNVYTFIHILFLVKEEDGVLSDDPSTGQVPVLQKGK